MATKKFTTISPLKTIFTLLVLACMCMQAKAFSWTWDANNSNGYEAYNTDRHVSSSWSYGEHADWINGGTSEAKYTGFQYSNENDYYFNTGNYTFFMKISSTAFESLGEITNDTKLRITLYVNYAQDGTDVSQIVFKNPVGTEWTDIKADYNHPNKGTCSYEFNSDEVRTIKTNGLAIGGKYINWNRVSIIELNGDSEMPLTTEAKEIESWYTAPLQIRSYDVEVGQTLRVYCKGRATGTNIYPTDDSYAFFKKDPLTHTPIMSGSDKFSIAGWEYFEIKINSELKNIINNEGLLIGGNNYIIDRVVVYGSGSAEEWTDGEAINTYTCNHETGNWNSLVIPGDFFQYIYSGNSKTTTTFNNTKNNIIRVNYNASGYNKQISVSDTKSQNNSQAYYTRYRKQNDDRETYQYQEYIDLDNNSDHHDFEMSDAITIFNTSVSPKTVVTGAEGVMKGMLSNVTQNGMSVNGNNLTITSVQILPSRVSRYVSGKAVYVHPFSKDQWRPMSLPYNLTKKEFMDAFIGKSTNVKYCQLGGADAVKKQFINDEKQKETDYFLKMHFVSADEIRCNYPYIVKLENEAPSDNTYTFNVKADVRDFQTYTFRTGELQYKTEEAGTEEWTEEDKTNYAPTDSYMNFVSTAPVFDIYNQNQGEVENYGTTVFFTPLAASSTTGDYNYYFYNGALCPAQTSKNLYSGLAYVQMSGSLHNLIEGQKVVNGQAKSMGFSTALFDIDDDENITSGIRTTEKFDQHVSKTAAGVYNFNGQLISRNADTSNLPKGMYIINGKKTIIK